MNIYPIEDYSYIENPKPNQELQIRAFYGDWKKARIVAVELPYITVSSDTDVLQFHYIRDAPLLKSTSTTQFPLSSLSELASGISFLQNLDIPANFQVGKKFKNDFETSENFLGIVDAKEDEILDIQVDREWWTGQIISVMGQDLLIKVWGFSVDYDGALWKIGTRGPDAEFLRPFSGSGKEGNILENEKFLSSYHPHVLLKQRAVYTERVFVNSGCSVCGNITQTRHHVWSCALCKYELCANCVKGYSTHHVPKVHFRPIFIDSPFNRKYLQCITILVNPQVGGFIQCHNTTDFVLDAPSRADAFHIAQIVHVTDLTIYVEYVRSRTWKTGKLCAMFNLIKDASKLENVNFKTAVPVPIPMNLLQMEVEKAPKMNFARKYIWK